MIDSQLSDVLGKNSIDQIFTDVKIVQVSKTRVDCKTLDGLLIKNIPVLFQSSDSYHRPKVGDVGVLVAPGGDINRAFIVGFKHLQKDELDKKTENRILAEDGTCIEYSDDTHTLKISGNKNLKLDIDVDVLNISAKGSINLDVKESEKLNNNGVVTGDCPCIMTGTNHAFTSSKVKAGK